MSLDEFKAKCCRDEWIDNRGSYIEKGRLKCLRRGNVLGYVWGKEIMLKGLYKWEDNGDYRLLNGNYIVIILWNVFVRFVWFRNLWWLERKYIKNENNFEESAKWECYLEE